MKQKKNLTFYINNYAYTVDLDFDSDDKIEEQITKDFNLSGNITTQELLLAYLKKTQEIIGLKRNIELQVRTLNDFQQKKFE